LCLRRGGDEDRERRAREREGRGTARVRTDSVRTMGKRRRIGEKFFEAESRKEIDGATPTNPTKASNPMR
jgi:hypothetical protein